MTRRLPWMLLLLGCAVAAAPAKKKPAAPPPPPVEEPVDEPAPPAEEDVPADEAPPLDEAPPDEPAVEAAPDEPPPAAKPSAKKKKKGNDDLTDDEAAAVGLASLCCCGVVAAFLVVLIIWLVRRKPAPAQATGQYGQPPPTPGAAMQLSIFALGLDPSARAIVDAQLAQASVSMVPTTVDGRGRLVRETARALLMVQSSWKQFGYGERSDLWDPASAEQAYRGASNDFRSRSQSVAVAPGGGLTVAILLICSRRALMGVSRLDEPLQVRNVLDDRLRVGDFELLGAELLWAPAAGGAVTEAEIALRFPEMQPLKAPI